MARFGLIIAALTCSAVLLTATAFGASSSATVKLAGVEFKPGKATIKQGGKLKLKWKSGTHNVKFDSSAGVDNIGVESSGTFSRTFKKSGSFQMVCTIHGGKLGSSGGMTAKVKVK